MNVGKSKVIRCSRYGNGDRIYVILNGEPLEGVDCFKYLGSQVAADGGCERDVVHRMNGVPERPPMSSSQRGKKRPIAGSGYVTCESKIC